MEDKIKTEDKLEALELIKRKYVIVALIRYCTCVQQYNDILPFKYQWWALKYCELTEAEFALLKYVLGDDAKMRKEMEKAWDKHFEEDKDNAKS